MASKHTSVYQLCQWEAGDKVLRTDFNEDNAKINAALRKHDGQLLGVPALGRHLYNLFLRQKNAGQDVSWMQGLVYDDFSDQSKIESMGEGMIWSPTEKCIHFTPSEGSLFSSLETTTQELGFSCAYAYLWIRHSLAHIPLVERWRPDTNQWYALEGQSSVSEFWSTTVTGTKCGEATFYQPISMGTTKTVKLRITLNAFNAPDSWPVKLYDYGCMLI